MEKNINYYYKGYDITNKNRLEYMIQGMDNPYGYNFESNAKRVVNYDYNVTHPNQDGVKNGEYLGKR